MIRGYAIEQVLPHAHPMILLSRFIEAGSDYAICQVDISPLSAFYQPELSAVPAYVGIEYMAQTIAAYAGANALQQGGKVQVGFLLGCRKYSPEVSHFTQGAVLKVKATKLVMDESGLSVFDCQISIEGQTVVTANLNVFQPQQSEA